MFLLKIKIDSAKVSDSSSEESLSEAFHFDTEELNNLCTGYLMKGLQVEIN
jgi:hypothetical protein